MITKAISNRVSTAWLFAPIVFLAAGCASVDRQAIQANLTSTQMAIEQAGRFDTDAHGALELRIAEEKLEQAHAAFERKDFKQADRLAEEALVNAQLVEAKARTRTTQNAANELRQSIATLKSETRRLQEIHRD